MALPKLDDWTNTNGTALTTHNAGYTLNSGNFAINTNSLYSNSSSVETGAHWATDTFNNDQYAFGTVSPLANFIYIGVSVRNAASANTRYALYTDATSDYTLYKIIAGAWTSLGTAAAAAAGDILRIEASSTAVLGKKNGSNSFGGPVTDSSIASGWGGVAGYGTGTGSRLDTFETGDLGGGAAGQPMNLRALQVPGMRQWTPKSGRLFKQQPERRIWAFNLKKAA